jgi:uncharacterized protein (TIRG00374 family)
VWKRLVLAFALAAAILALLASRMDASVVWSSLVGVRWELLVLSAALQALGLWLKAQRWVLAIAAGSGERPRRRALAATVIGNAANLMLPARLGDIARALVLRRHNDVSASQALIASWSVNLFDVVVVVLLLLGSGSRIVPRRALVLTLGGGLLLLAVLALAHQGSGAVRHLEHALLRGRAERLRAPLERARQGLRFLGHGGTLGSVLLLTLFVWACDVVSCLVGMHAFGIRLGLAPAALLVSAAGISFALPLTPGNVGIFQAICIPVLGAFGVPAERAFAFGLGAQGFSLLASIAWGLALLQREGLSLAWFRGRLAAAPDA